MTGPERAPRLSALVVARNEARRRVKDRTASVKR